MIKFMYIPNTFASVSNTISKIHIRNNARFVFKRNLDLESQIPNILNYGETYNNLSQPFVLEKLDSGTNHQVFKYKHSNDEYLLKMASQNKSIRLAKELLALIFMDTQDEKLAPKPIAFFREKDNLSVLIAEWIQGKVYQEPPQQDSEWVQIVEHYFRIHSNSPSFHNIYVQSAYQNPCSKQKSKKFIESQIGKVPKEFWPNEIKALLKLWEEKTFINWSTPKVAFCRGDGNFTNLIMISKGIISVDWEFSGWGDPYFDLASLLAHPAYVDSNLSKVQWVADYYNGLDKQKDFHQKINDYLLTLFIYWAARYLNLLYNTDQTKTFNWRDRPSLRQENYEKYVKRGWDILSDFNRKFVIG